MLTKGPQQDIFRADEAHAIVQRIGEHAEAVTASMYVPTFVALQQYSIEQFVLAITRLFDAPKKNYPLRSLPAIVQSVIEHADTLPIKEPAFLQTALTHLAPHIEGFDPSKGGASTLVAMGIVQARLPTPDTSPAVEALKALRDKRLAHPEHIEAESIPKTAWSRPKRCRERLS